MLGNGLMGDLQADVAPGTVLSSLISYNLWDSGGTRGEGMAN